uniref:Uncharacterized protein n=1 Tax=Klebsiella pneumoniae TaxID=573 RepID=A0A8B0SV94_KLEPN|nr:hypothetical protein [Klebsiella pneumoniae]
MYSLFFSSDCGKPRKLCIWICNFNSINALYYTVSCRDISYSFSHGECLQPTNIGIAHHKQIMVFMSILRLPEDLKKKAFVFS